MTFLLAFIVINRRRRRLISLKWFMVVSFLQSLLHIWLGFPVRI